MKFADAQMIDERFLHGDEIADRYQRKIEAVRPASVWVDACRARGDDMWIVRIEIDQRVGREDEITVGIDRLARAD